MKALQGDPQCVTDMVAQFEARRNAMVEKINSIPGLSCMKPQGAFYIMLNITGVMGKTYNGRVIDSSQTFAELLLADKHVAVVPGNAFEAEGFCRLSYAVPFFAITYCIYEEGGAFPCSNLTRNRTC